MLHRSFRFYWGLGLSRGAPQVSAGAPQVLRRSWLVPLVGPGPGTPIGEVCAGAAGLGKVRRHLFYFLMYKIS